MRAAINRPNTWLRRLDLRRGESPCQHGAVHTWHFSPVVCLALVSHTQKPDICRKRELENTAGDSIARPKPGHGARKQQAILEREIAGLLKPG